jgi:hypothetical protein
MNSAFSSTILFQFHNSIFVQLIVHVTGIALSKAKFLAVLGTNLHESNIDIPHLPQMTCDQRFLYSFVLHCHSAHVPPYHMTSDRFRLFNVGRRKSLVDVFEGIEFSGSLGSFFFDSRQHLTAVTLKDFKESCISNRSWVTLCIFIRFPAVRHVPRALL